MAGAALLAWPGKITPQAVCGSCHPAIAESYSKTAMARSFYRPKSVASGEFYHAASDTRFTMFERGGQFFQRRFQTGFGGAETNVDEKRIDFVMGSGNHARTFLHRTRAGEL